MWSWLRTVGQRQLLSEPFWDAKNGLGVSESLRARRRLKKTSARRAGMVWKRSEVDTSITDSRYHTVVDIKYQPAVLAAVAHLGGIKSPLGAVLLDVY